MVASFARILARISAHKSDRADAIEAAGELAQLCTAEGDRFTIGKGCLPTIVECVSGNSHTMKENNPLTFAVLLALYNVAQDPRNCDFVAAHCDQLYGVLLRLLSKSSKLHTEGKLRTAQCLNLLLKGKGASGAVVKAGILPIVSTLQSPSRGGKLEAEIALKLQTECLEVIRSLAANPESHDIIVNSGGLDAILDVLRKAGGHPESENLRSSTIAVIGLLSVSERTHVDLRLVNNVRAVFGVAASMAPSAEILNKDLWSPGLEAGRILCRIFCKYSSEGQVILPEAGVPLDVSAVITRMGKSGTVFNPQQFTETQWTEWALSVIRALHPEAMTAASVSSPASNLTPSKRRHTFLLKKKSAVHRQQQSRTPSTLGRTVVTNPFAGAQGLASPVVRAVEEAEATPSSLKRGMREAEVRALRTQIKDVREEIKMLRETYEPKRQRLTRSNEVKSQALFSPTLTSPVTRTTPASERKGSKEAISALLKSPVRAQDAEAETPKISLGALPMSPDRLMVVSTPLPKTPPGRRRTKRSREEMENGAQVMQTPQQELPATPVAHGQLPPFISPTSAAVVGTPLPPTPPKSQRRRNPGQTSERCRSSRSRLGPLPQPPRHSDGIRRSQRLLEQVLAAAQAQTEAAASASEIRVASAKQGSLLVRNAEDLAKTIQKLKDSQTAAQKATEQLVNITSVLAAVKQPLSENDAVNNEPDPVSAFVPFSKTDSGEFVARALKKRRAGGGMYQRRALMSQRLSPVSKLNARAASPRMSPRGLPPRSRAIRRS